MLKEIILEQSYWFSEKKIKKTWRYQRDKFFDLEKKLVSKNKIIALIGPRQTGKTTILMQLIDRLLQKQKIKPEHILYLSFDHPLLTAQTYTLDQIFQTYQEEVLKQTFREAKQKIFIFLDEIQKLNHWQDYLKYWVDLKLNLCFFVSGSSGIQIIKGGGESLIGRLDLNFLLPLSFSEVGRITKDKDLFTTEEIDLFKDNFLEIKKLYQKKNIYDKKYQVILADYLKKGGYPEIYNLKDSQEIKKYLLTLKSLSIHRDIVELEQVRDPKTLENTLTLLAGQNANRLNYENIAGKLAVKLDTIKKYISYLESAFLVKEAYVLTDKFIQSAAKQRKIFFLDTGLKNVVWSKPEIDDLFENIIFIEVLRRKLESEVSPQMFYGLTKNGQQEVDVIWQDNSYILPIEVKYKWEIEKKDIVSLSQYLFEAKEKRGIIINRSEFRLERTKSQEIIIMPFWLFLMMR